MQLGQNYACESMQNESMDLGFSSGTAILESFPYKNHQGQLDVSTELMLEEENAQYGSVEYYNVQVEKSIVIFLKELGVKTKTEPSLKKDLYYSKRQKLSFSNTKTQIITVELGGSSIIQRRFGLSNVHVPELKETLIKNFKNLNHEQTNRNYEDAPKKQIKRLC